MTTIMGYTIHAVEESLIRIVFHNPPEDVKAFQYRYNPHPVWNLTLTATTEKKEISPVKVSFYVKKKLVSHQRYCFH